MKKNMKKLKKTILGVTIALLSGAGAGTWGGELTLTSSSLSPREEEELDFPFLAASSEDLYEEDWSEKRSEIQDLIDAERKMNDPPFHKKQEETGEESLFSPLSGEAEREMLKHIQEKIKEFWKNLKKDKRSSQVFLYEYLDAPLSLPSSPISRCGTPKPGSS